MGCIYLVTNLLTDKVYVGMSGSSNFSARQKAHTKLALANSPLYFHRALRKYGVVNFEWRILELVQGNRILLGRRETFYIGQYASHGPHGYNMTDGGDGMINASEEVRRKIGIGNRKQKKHKGRPLSDAHKESLRISKKQKPTKHWEGKKFSDDHRRKLSESARSRTDVRWNKGKPLSEDQRRQISERQKGKTGRKHSAETRQRLSQIAKTRLRKKLTIEHRQKISIGVRRAKKVIDIAE